MGIAYGLPVRYYAMKDRTRTIDAAEHLGCRGRGLAGYLHAISGDGPYRFVCLKTQKKYTKMIGAICPCDHENDMHAIVFPDKWVGCVYTGNSYARTNKNKKKYEGNTNGFAKFR